MKVSEYLEKSGNIKFTFIKARARKDSYSPMYHPEYQTTPLRYKGEWEEDGRGCDRILESIVLNDKQPSITWLSGADWNGQINMGLAKCLLIIHPDDFKLLIPGKQQREHMEAFIDKVLFM